MASGPSINCPECHRPAEEGASYCSVCGAHLFASSEHTQARSGTAYEPVLQLAPGQTFGERFTVVEEIGVGGMGSVYKAMDPDHGRPVALKLLRSQSSSREVGLERFKRELSLAKQVDHPNVCHVHNMGEESGIRFISMEYIDGQSVEDLLRSVGTLSVRQSVTLLRQICAGLQAIHDCSIVHRDLKPSNIMLDRHGRAVVMDFGLAYQTGAEKLTKEGQVLGTLAYISPEQATGKPVDARTDIYAMGLILYELLSGKRAPGDDGRAPLALRSSENCLPPSELTPEVPTELDEIVLKCLERDPNKRFQSMTELSDALSRLETSVSNQVIAQRRASKARHWPWFVGLAAALLVGVVLALVLFRSSPPSGPEGIAMLPLSYEGPSESAYLKNIVPFLLGEELRDATSIAVTPFDSSRSFEPEDSPVHVAQQLTVGHILSGNIRISGDQFDATLELTGSDGEVSWSRDLSGDRREIFNVMSPVAGDLMVALGAGSTRDEGLMHRHAPEALTAYMQGRTFLEGWDTATNYTRAENSFREAIAVEEAFAEAHAGLALALWTHYGETKEPELVEEARSAAEKAVSLGPMLPEAHLAKGVVLLGMGRTAEAVVSLEKAQELAPADDANYRYVAGAYESLGRNEEAEQMYQRAINLRPSFWVNYNHKGAFHLSVGELELAKALFRKIVELRPESATGYNNLATAYILDGELLEAEPLLQAALRIEPIADSHDNLGFIYYSTGRFEEAAEEFSKAADMRPNVAISWGNLGDAYRQLGREQEMTTAYLRAIELTEGQLDVDPGDRHTRLGYAIQLAGVQRCNEARKQIERGLGEGPDQPYLNYYAALAFSVCDERELVIEHMRLALEGGIVADIKTSPDLKLYLDEPSLQALLK